MEFYKKVDEMLITLKETKEYKAYIKLKKEIKADKTKSQILAEFKNKQKQIQLDYIKNNGAIDVAEKEKMEKLYAIIVKNKEINEFLQLEIEIDLMLGNMQKMVAEAIVEINEF